MARHDKVNLICHHKLTIAYVIWWCPVYVTQYVEFWSGWYIQLAYLSDKSKCTNMGSWAKYVWKMLSMNTKNLINDHHDHSMKGMINDHKKHILWFMKILRSWITFFIYTLFMTPIVLASWTLALIQEFVFLSILHYE